MWDPENEPTVFCQCTECGEDIFYNEEYYRIPSPIKIGEYLPYCKECVENSVYEEEFEPPDNSDRIYDEWVEDRMINGDY